MYRADAFISLAPDTSVQRVQHVPAPCDIVRTVTLSVI
jgi:hypothetical protein